jgi:hypothetical protein
MLAERQFVRLLACVGRHGDRLPLFPVDPLDHRHRAGRVPLEVRGPPWLRCTTWPHARHGPARAGRGGGLLDLFEDAQHPLEGDTAMVERRHYEGRWYRLRRPGQRLPS